MKTMKICDLATKTIMGMCISIIVYGYVFSLSSFYFTAVKTAVLYARINLDAVSFQFFSLKLLRKLI